MQAKWIRKWSEANNKASNFRFNFNSTSSLQHLDRRFQFLSEAGSMHSNELKWCLLFNRHYSNLMRSVCNRVKLVCTVIQKKYVALMMSDEMEIRMQLFSCSIGIISHGVVSSKIRKYRVYIPFSLIDTSLYCFNLIVIIFTTPGKTILPIVSVNAGGWKGKKRCLFIRHAQTTISLKSSTAFNKIQSTLKDRLRLAIQKNSIAIWEDYQKVPCYLIKR